MELEAFDAQFADAVERSFRDEAIRTAVLIDDQFPNYVQIGNGAEGFTEAERAKRLYAFLHGRGLICDIQNWRTPDDTDMNLVDKVRKSDLVVLDYQMGAGGPATALSILRHLAISPHFNLVVLYTSDPLGKVALAAAIAMRGLAPPAADKQPSQALLDAADEILASDEFQTIDSDGLLQYLAKGATPWSADLRTALEAAQINPANLKPLADHVARSWISQLFENFTPSDEKILPLRHRLDDPDAMWLHCGSCFVAILNKLPAGAQEDEGAFIWRRLGQTLRSWRPNLYRLILSDIQNALEQEAVADHEAWLDDNLCLGLGLYLFESEERATGPAARRDVEGSTQSLIDRFVDIIRRRLASHDQVTAKAADLLEARLTVPLGEGAAGENARHARARELAHYDGATNINWPIQVIPTVNAFMVSDAFRSSHITTGTVLKTDNNSYWLCASPACDLEPRGSGPVILKLIRLLPITTPRDVFTTGECIAITGPTGPVILQALDPKTRLPSLKTVFLPDGTHVTRDPAQPSASPTINGWFATGMEPSWPVYGETPSTTGDDETSQAQANTADGDAAAESGDQPAAGAEKVAMQSLKLTAPTIFVVVSQLRTAFATRFLMTAGQHLSRIGVDFVDA